MLVMVTVRFRGQDGTQFHPVYSVETPDDGQ